MAPFSGISVLAVRAAVPPTANAQAPTRANLSTDGIILEAWAEGYMVGSIVILIMIVFCNYRSRVWLHKLIVFELVLAIWHGTFIFFNDPVYGWYLSSTAALLFISYFVHNVIAWLKIRPFLSKWWSRFFIISILCVQPFWVVEAWSNFAYFNSLGNTVNTRLRPWEALVRDPWWVFTTLGLVYAIKKSYNFKLWTLVGISPRFGVMLLCMALSIIFSITDIVVNAAHYTVNSGIDPYWRFATVFKCASDTIFLDDFKSVLDSILARKFSSSGETTSSRKRAASTRGTELIECTVLENASPASNQHNVPVSPLSRMPNSLPNLRKASATDREAQRDQISEASSSVDPPLEEIEDAVLTRLTEVFHGTNNMRTRDSDESIIFGRHV